MCGGPPPLTQLVCLSVCSSRSSADSEYGVALLQQPSKQIDPPRQATSAGQFQEWLASLDSKRRFMIRRSSRSALLLRVVRDENQLDPASRLGSFASAGQGRSVSFRAFGETFVSGAPRRKSRHCEQLRLHWPQPSSRSRPAGDGARGHTAGGELPSTQ